MQLPHWCRHWCWSRYEVKGANCGTNSHLVGNKIMMLIGLPAAIIVLQGIKNGNCWNNYHNYANCWSNSHLEWNKSSNSWNYSHLVWNKHRMIYCSVISHKIVRSLRKSCLFFLLTASVPWIIHWCANLMVLPLIWCPLNIDHPACQLAETSRVKRSHPLDLVCLSRILRWIACWTSLIRAARTN